MDLSDWYVLRGSIWTCSIWTCSNGYVLRGRIWTYSQCIVFGELDIFQTHQYQNVG